MTSSPASLPDNPVLAEVAREIEQTRWAAALIDDAWRLVWVSEELKVLIGERDEAKLGYGKHILESYLNDAWSSTITPESQQRALLRLFPIYVAETPGGREAVYEILDRGLAARERSANPLSITDEERAQIRDVLDSLEPRHPPQVWVDTLEFLQGDLPPVLVTEFHFRMHDYQGNRVGTAVLYGSALPARLLSLVARGDEAMFTRMARLVKPGRVPAGILFADLQSSATLSRHLPSAAYFKLIRAIITAVDDVVVEHKGIVGKHAGDGVTAFFLADDAGSVSAAARETIDAAQAISVAASNAAKQVAGETGLIEAADCLVNVAVHWGGALYMGPLVTGGRLEVTALGDEVNECARMQQSARDGEVLASKSLIERLSAQDADELNIDPDAVLYRTVAELPAATDKATRDAGGIPVTVL